LCPEPLVGDDGDNVSIIVLLDLNVVGQTTGAGKATERFGR
jgi:hypothetical protein